MGRRKGRASLEERTHNCRLYLRPLRIYTSGMGGGRERGGLYKKSSIDEHTTSSLSIVMSSGKMSAASKC